MSVIFSDHLDGTNGTTLSGGVNTSFSVIGTSSATCTYDTSVHALGTSSMKCTQTASFGGVTAANHDLTTPTSTEYRRWCFQMSVLPLNGNCYISQACTSTGAFTARVAITPAGKVVVYNGTTLASTSTTVLAANTMYRFEWDLVGTTSTLRIYGSPTSTTILETITTTITGTAFSRANYGIPAAGNNNLMTVWIDEVVHDSTTTPGPVGGTPASSTGSLGFTGRTTSSQAASATGAIGFGGSSMPLTTGGKIAGLSDLFLGQTLDLSKWNASGGATVNNGAKLPCVPATSKLTSAQVWDATSSTIFAGINPPVSGSGDLLFTLINRADATKYLQVKVSGGQLSATILDGGADPSPVTRAVTINDNVIRLTENAGSIVIDVRSRNSTTWTTLRTLTAPTWWNNVLVQLGGYAASGSAIAVFGGVNAEAVQPSGHLPSSTLTDDFTGSVLNAVVWAVTGPGVITDNDDVEIAAVTAGHTQVTSVNSYALDTASLRVRAAINSTGDYTTFKVLAPTPGHEARFVLTNGTISAEYRVADVPDAFTATVTHDNTQAVYLQFLADLPNNNLVWSYSLDGINYSVIRQSPLPSWYTGVQVAFSSKAA